MPNLAYFEVPADDPQRVRKFYKDLLGWHFEKSENPEIKMDYWTITTGDPEEGTVNMGGMYKKPMEMNGIVLYVKVPDLDKALAKVGKLGGKILYPKMTVKSVGSMATISDTEGNSIALWEPEKQ